MTTDADPPVAASRFRLPLGMTAALAPALALLISLGVWQLQRLEWKTALLADLEARREAEPIGFDEALARARNGEDLRFAPVSVSGRFAHVAQMHMPATQDGRSGWRIITPFVTADNQLLFVERGFFATAQDELAPAPVGEGELSARQSVLVLVRPEARPGWLADALIPDPDLDRGVFYRWDRMAMAEWARGVGAFGEVPLAPFDAAVASPAAGPPVLTASVPKLSDIPNRHLEYALTWFALATVLVGVYAAYQWSAWRAHRRGAASG